MIIGYHKLQAIWRYIALALVLVVSVHALAPNNAPTAPESGAAFNAFTLDVSLGCREQAAAEQKFRADNPAPPPDIPPLSLAAQVVHADRGLGNSKYCRKGTPSGAVAQYTPLNPRAPPFV